MQSTTVSLRRVPQGRLALWLLIAGELIIFGSAIVVYLLLRLRYPEWGAEAAKTHLSLGAFNTLVLLVSSYFAAKAHEASLKKLKGKVLRYLSLTVLCGLIFLGVKSYEYTEKISHGYTFTSPKLVEAGQGAAALFWSFYYFLTGLHALHVLVGLIAIGFIMYYVKNNKHFHRVELVALYWHMVDLIWIFLFPLLYIMQ